MKAAILAIGTEITDGQIVNRNASWLSEKLKGLGARVATHLAVPDDRGAIARGLDICAEGTDLIFVTGGLGPTTDDFTRDIVSEWSKCPLEFNADAWTHVQSLLTSRGFPVHDFQKQQCHFPKGSVILRNERGTAHGFRFFARDHWLIVLPGPPREVLAVWDAGLATWLEDHCLGADPMITRSWDLLGWAESQVAAAVEPLVSGRKGLEVGYRAHLPYVEAKLTFARSRSNEFKDLVAAVDKALAAGTVCRDGEDLAALVVPRLTSAFHIFDDVTGGFLLARLQPHLKDAGLTWTYSQNMTREPRKGLVLFIEPAGAFEVRVGRIESGQEAAVVIETPLRAPQLEERRRQYFAEMALNAWRTL